MSPLAVVDGIDTLPEPSYGADDESNITAKG